jgi:teichuronic acid biosynthesis glycosyltransferase TuaC
MIDGVRVAVVAEYYPRGADPVLGIWAHRQALAAREAGADVRVLVLHRPVPPLAALRVGNPGRGMRAVRAVRQPRRATLDGIDVIYVPFLAPPRPLSYGSWGAWAAPTAGAALRALRRRFRFDLVHAHYAVPAGEAVRRSLPGAPLVVSVHGGDVLHTAPRWPAGRRAVEATFAHARLVLPNSAGTERRCRSLGARATRVVHLGTDLPPPAEPAARSPAGPEAAPVLASVGHLVPRKRHGDVLRALAILRGRVAGLRLDIVGDGPERAPLERLAAELDLGSSVTFHGQLAHPQALRIARAATAFVLPSVDEAFGVAYVEAMAAGVPAIGCRGEDGPEEIAAAGPGMSLVGPGDVEGLAREIERLAGRDGVAPELGRQARETVARHFTWERCGAATVAAYETALATRTRP